MHSVARIDFDAAAAPYVTDTEPEPRDEVTLTEFDPEGETKVVASALYAVSALPDDQLLTIRMCDLDLRIEGTQIEPRDDSDYRVWAQLGVTHVCVDPPGSPHYWSLDALRRSGWKGHGPVPWEHEANRGFLRSLNALRLASAAPPEVEHGARGEKRKRGQKARDEADDDAGEADAEEGA